jgi:hypothetical protein
MQLHDLHPAVEIQIAEAGRTITAHQGGRACIELQHKDGSWSPIIL